MAWHYGTYSCGHEGRTNIIGPTKNRGWISEQRFAGRCSECQEIYKEEKRREENLEASKKAEEMELPMLIGSDKQIVWANTLRIKLIEKLANMLNGTNLDGYIHKAIDVLTSKKDATFYINNRNTDVMELIEQLCKETVADEDIPKDIIKEAIVAPIEVKECGIVKIIISETDIKLEYEKNAKFIAIAKKLGYNWTNHCWTKHLNEYTGTYVDRGAELGNNLLNKGFAVQIFDEQIRNKAINADFNIEYRNWVKLREEGKYAGWFAIKSFEYREKVKMIKGSKYDSKSMVIPITQYKEVMDFADMNGFKISTKAQEAIDLYIKSKTNIINKTQRTNHTEKELLRNILNSDCEVLNELKD